MPVARLGGTFAPPLTDELMVQYGELIEAMPQSPVKDAMSALYACCDKWWNLPEPSHGLRLQHPMGSGRLPDGTPFNPSIVPLEKAHAEALYDDIPWGHELESYKTLFHNLDLDVCKRNDERVTVWFKTVAEHIVSQEFPNLNEFRVIRKNLAAAEELLTVMESQNRQTVGLKSQIERVKAVSAKVTQAHSTKTYGPIPYPQREPAPTRDAAYHLLWHVCELDKDREPITNDLIRG